MLPLFAIPRQFSQHIFIIYVYDQLTLYGSVNLGGFGALQNLFPSTFFPDNSLPKPAAVCNSLNGLLFPKYLNTNGSSVRSFSLSSNNLVGSYSFSDDAAPESSSSSLSGLKASGEVPEVVACAWEADVEVVMLKFSTEEGEVWSIGPGAACVVVFPKAEARAREIEMEGSEPPSSLYR